MSFRFLSRHPKELWILSLSESCERFAFWGVGNLLVLYLIEFYHYPNENATHVYGIFTGFAAFLPFVGGFIADRWNYRSPLLVGALFNALGCFFIALGSHEFLFLSLAIIALGYGMFTPSLVTLLGYSYRNCPDLREAGFSIYYASINVGVFLALVSLGTIAKLVGWNWAFFFAGIVQIIGLIPIFLYFKNHKENADHHPKKSEENIDTPLSRIEKDRMLVIGIFCLISLFFWAAYNQAFSSMAIFTHSFLDKKIGSITLPEGVILSSESFFLLLLAPILAALYSWLQKKKKDPSPATKTALSLAMIACCFLVMAWASFPIAKTATSAQVPIGYFFSAFFLMALGEMLLAPIGLSMVSRLAPKKFGALSIGFWYVCVGIAFYSGGMLAGLMGKVGGLFHFFSIFVVISIIPGFVLFLFRKKLTKLSHHPSIEKIDPTMH